MDLAASETYLLVGATPSRVRELKGGRTLARVALSKLAVQDAVITSGANGEPIWPHKYCGSISHSPTHAAALVGPQSRFRALGLDICDTRPLGDDLKNRVVTPNETKALHGLLSDFTDDIGNAVFSMKEAFFECQFVVTGLAEVAFPDVTLFPIGKGEIGVSCLKVKEKVGDLSRVRVTLERCGGVLLPCAYWPA